MFFTVILWCLVSGHPAYSCLRVRRVWAWLVTYIIDRHRATFRKRELVKVTLAQQREAQAPCIAHFVEYLEEVTILSKAVKVSNSAISG